VDTGSRSSGKQYSANACIGSTGISIESELQCALSLNMAGNMNLLVVTREQHLHAWDAAGTMGRHQPRRTGMIAQQYPSALEYRSMQLCVYLLSTFCL